MLAAWDWLEGREGGCNGRSRKTSGSPERDLVVSRPRSLCTSPLLAPINGEWPEILTNDNDNDNNSTIEIGRR